MIKGSAKRIKTNGREEKSQFRGMLLDALAYSILWHSMGNMFSSKGVIRAGEGRIRAGQNF